MVMDSLGFPMTYPFSSRTGTSLGLQASICSSLNHYLV